ncbi:YraN family protein [Prosthecochloris sp. N3]|uniref:UPF0102 protein INT08_05270 n=1 Tax=Prosthecochloris ethylica TaxID=2743976 RepID=A0ABR9XRH0_9CHLB|nr:MULTISPECIES: YraN family protein [Prosthecochloris]MEC9487213.1 YraN family protein [Prosthecochloris sp.]MBF0586010.1 YraN family protein [Prosthecochloris ethylica]MBF0636590.1 YraN family protein [Prosthecochloris ethylica]NUK47222.1 YraN family protein [Prosthecochloris ethylica]RNA64028.1 YraN family protein [Prosthecochloris sp. ZM_2]
MPLIPHDLGRRGEQIAAGWLADQGMRIIRRNYRYRRNEIDIIALDGPVLCFIEVKTRASLRAGHPLEAVTRAKQREIIRTARAFLAFDYPGEPDCRFDVVAIIANGWNEDDITDYSLQHIRNAFAVE